MGLKHWLPEQFTGNWLLWHHTAILTEQGKWNHRIISVIRDGQTADEARRIRPKPPKTYRNPIFVAKEYARMLESGDAKNESDLARNLEVPRVTVNHFVRLLKLDASIIRSLEQLGDPLPKRMITERRLRPYLYKTSKEQEKIKKLITLLP